MTATVGVDPGAKWCGVVVRDGADAVWWRVVAESDHGHRFLPACEAAVREAFTAAGTNPLVAVEDAVPPGGFRDGKKQFARPVDILALGRAVGWLHHAVLLLTPRVVLVAPAGHGHRPLGSYPRVLVSDAEARSADRVRGWGRPAGQSSTLRHARSAWDVAGAGPVAARVDAARAGVGAV